MVTRRTFLLLLGSSPVLLVGASKTDAARLFTRDDPAPRNRAVVPYIAADRAYPVIALSATEVERGQALGVSVDRGLAGTLTAFGRTYELTPTGTGGLEGAVPVSLEDPVGSASIAIDVTEAEGMQFATERTVQVLIPNVASDGVFPALDLSTTSVYQGGAFKVLVANAASGTATFFGRSYLLAPDGEGGLSGFVGLGTQDPAGPATLTVDVLEAGGAPYAMTETLQVLATQWTVDYIWLPPPPDPGEEDPNAPEPPPPPPDEAPLLPGIYAGITARKWQDGWGAPLDELVVTGYFGEQRSFNGGPVQGHHGGTDFGANMGTPIYSTNDGVVVMSGRYLTRGNLVVVDHGTGIFSLYGHMSERAVSVGDFVAKGEVLGYVGSTGLSTGAHLHWEMSVAGVLVDGLRWLDGTQGF